MLSRARPRHSMSRRVAQWCLQVRIRPTLQQPSGFLYSSPFDSIVERVSAFSTPTPIVSDPDSIIHLVDINPQPKYILHHWYALARRGAPWPPASNCTVKRNGVWQNCPCSSRSAKIAGVHLAAALFSMRPELVINLFRPGLCRALGGPRLGLAPRLRRNRIAGSLLCATTDLSRR
jgi:hypothetical protein